LTPLEILEKLLMEKWHLELTTFTAEIYFKTASGLSQDVEIKTQYKDKEGESVDIAIGKMLNPFQIVEGMMPLDKDITAKLNRIVVSRIQVDIEYWWNAFEIKDHDYYESQDPPVGCGGLRGRGKTLLEAADSMILQIEKAQAWVVERERGSCSASQ
jgi:hypothetical protein